MHPNGSGCLWQPTTLPIGGAPGAGPWREALVAVIRIESARGQGAARGAARFLLLS
jgi:hypothetical protein